MDPFDLENALLTEDPTTGEQVVGIPEDKEEQKKVKEIARQFKSEKIGDANAMVDKADIARLLNQQESGIEKLQQALIDAKSAPKSVDWKPFAAWLDAGVKGQHLAEAVPAHETPQARAEKIARIENLIQEARKDTTKNAIDAVKTQLVRQQLADVRRQNFMEGQSLRKEDTLRKDIYSITAPLEETNQMFSTMDENLGKGDYVSVMNSLSNFSRSVSGEKGVLTDRDIERVMPPTFIRDVSKITAYFGSPDVRQDPSLLSKMKGLIETAKRKLAEKAMQNLKAKRGVYQNPKSQYYDIAAPGSGAVGDVLFKNAEQRIKEVGGLAPSADQATVPQQPRLPTFEEFKKMRRGQ